MKIQLYFNTFKLEIRIKIMKYKCIKCGKIWQGWTPPDIYPDCGSNLEKVKQEKKIKENIEKFNYLHDYLSYKINRR